MICPFCRTENDDEYSFCVSCGKEMLTGGATNINPIPPTQVFTPQSNEPPSVETAFLPDAPFQNPYQTSENQAALPKNSRRGALIAAVTIIALLVVGAAAGGLYLWNQSRSVAKKQVLPDHLGFFVQTSDKSSLDEIKMRDVANLLEEKEKFSSDESLTRWTKNGNFILFADAKEVPLTDLKLVSIDSISNEGTLDQLEFQASPVDGEPNMKILRVPAGFANGKYAFALFNGLLDKGNHKIWAFQVKDASKADNSDSVQKLSLNVSASPTPEESPEPKAEQPKKDQKVPAPVGSTVAFCTGNDVILRSTPSLEGKKVGKLSKGQRIYVLNYSDNYDEWRGNVANWAFIQTESGNRGWVFTPFVSS
ncbi:MAG: SH3 domain-containing protein [Pyrinomonadaceae bacterium]|nr:SH3 domain-containing protein [Pyrinomonadaceae bacterium]